MTNQQRFATSPRSTIRRHPERGSSERTAIYEVLDQGILAHVAFLAHQQPFVIPMAYARLDEEVILHGSPGSRLMDSVADGRPVCLTVTHLDGLVVARSSFHSSMNYRSVVLFGNCRRIDDLEEKTRVLNALADHLIPGRTTEPRPTTASELAGTAVVAFGIQEATVKIRTGPPKEPDRDHDYPTWAGVIPIECRYGEPVPAPNLEGEWSAPQLSRHGGSKR